MAILLCILALSATAAAQLQARLTTTDPIELGGSVRSTADGGVHVPELSHGDDVRLSAQRIHVIMEQEKGRSADGPLIEVNRVQEDGTFHWNFTDVRAEVTPAPGPSTVFTEPSPANTTTFEATSFGRSTISPFPEDELVTAAGYPPGVEVSRNAPDYRYRTDRPLLEQTGVTQAGLSGDFTLFVHNVTIDVDHADGRWRNWTGYREGGDRRPDTGYELRVTRIYVTDGELRTRTDEQDLALLAPAIEADVEGTVSLASASGHLGTAEKAISLDADPLELTGDGHLSTDAREGEIAAEGRGEFEVVSPERLIPASDGDPPTDPMVPGVALIGLLAVAGVLAHRRPATLRVLPTSLRDRLFWRWFRRGRDREDRRAFAEAADLYHRSTSVRPSKPLGWFHRAKAELEAGDAQAALAVVTEAEERLEAVPLDLVELEVAAAYAVGDDERAKRALLRVADETQAMARSLVEDLSLDRLTCDPKVRDALGTARGDGGMQGYV